MSVRDLIPWGRSNNQLPTAFRDDDRNPFLSLHREVNRLFDDVFRGFDGRLPAFGSLSSFNGAWPKVEISETDKDIKVTAEIPGLEEKDIEVLIDDGVLTLKGEKRSETEDKEKLVVVVEPFRQGEHDGFGIGDGIHGDVIALEGPYEGFGHAVPLGALDRGGERLQADIAGKAAGRSCDEAGAVVGHSMVWGKRLTLPKRCSTAVSMRFRSQQ